jgi:Flp pilus assembly protein TadD
MLAEPFFMKSTAKARAATRVRPASPKGARFSPDGATLLAAIWLAALGLRALYVQQIADAPFFDLRLGDAESYHLWARRIAGGDWLGSDVFYQAPLYPYVLACIYGTLGESALIVRVVQAALGAASCTLLAAAGMSLFGRTGLLAGLALAVYPPAIFLDGLLEKSALVTFFVTALLALLAAPESARPWVRWLAVGLTLGLLTLARENALILAVPIACWIALGPLSGRRTAAALIVAAGCAAILLPVALRNRAVSGELYLTTSQLGPNFYIGNHDGATGTYDALVVGHGSARDERADATRIAEQALGRTLTPSEVSSYWTGRALEYIRSQPVAWLRLLGRKLALTFGAAEVSDTESLEVYAEWSWLLRMVKPFDFGVVFGLAVFGTIVTWPSRRRLWFLHALAGAYAVTLVLFYVFARYRFPLVPILMTLAAGGVAQAAACSRRRVSVAAGGAAVSFALATIPVDDARAARAVHYAGIATALSEDRARTAHASAFYERALREAPDFPAAQFGLARLLTATGRREEAIPRYRAALRAWPSYFEAHYNLGVALAATGRTEDAVEEYQLALTLRPEDLDARLALARALVMLGRPEQAIVEYERCLARDPASTRAMVGLGVALTQVGRTDAAVRTLRRAVDLDPANAAAHNSLGYALAAEGRIAEAVPHFERSVELNPGDENARKNLERARQIGR